MYADSSPEERGAVATIAFAAVGLLSPGSRSYRAAFPKNINNNLGGHSARNASSGEIKLARMAGTIDASNADSPSAMTAAIVTAGLYGFIP